MAFNSGYRRSEARGSKEHKGEVESGKVGRAEARHESVAARCCKLRRGAASSGEARRGTER